MFYFIRLFIYLILLYSSILYSLLQIWELHCLKLQEYLLLKSLEKLMLVCCKYCGRYGDGEPSY
ncbi:hypothetical protein Hanom_Chr14g01273791 [Helianthus anomalus]